MEASKTNSQVSVMKQWRRQVRRLERFCALFLVVVFCAGQAGTQEVTGAAVSAGGQGGWRPGWRSNASKPVYRNDGVLENATLKKADSVPYEDNALHITDTDKDGIDDVWENRYFGNLTTAGKKTDGVYGYTDYDGDGLNDLYEYLAGTNPLENGQEDELADPDNDGRSNLEEQKIGSHPHDTDTDKDGVADKDEWDNAYGGDPLNPFKPYRPKYLSMGTPGQDVVWPVAKKLASLKKYTVEFWFRNTSESTDGRILTMQSPEGDYDEFRFFVKSGKLCFAVADIRDRLKAQTQETPDSGIAAKFLVDQKKIDVPQNKWIHVSAAVEQPEVGGQYTMTLRVWSENQEYEAKQTVTGQIALEKSAGDLVVGGRKNTAMTFDLDELRIWNSVRTASEIADLRNVPLTGKPADLAVYLSMDDGRGRNAVADYNRDTTAYQEFEKDCLTLGSNNKILAYYAEEHKNLRDALCLLNGDRDGDGIWDGWELWFFGNLETAGPDTDYDQDGMTDHFESLVYRNSASENFLDPTRIDSGVDDIDGDGLTNEQELAIGTDPANPDTDDDAEYETKTENGVPIVVIHGNDKDEWEKGTSPTHPGSQLVKNSSGAYEARKGMPERSLDMTAQNGVTIPYIGRFAVGTGDFTVEMHVKTSTDVTAGTLFKYIGSTGNGFALVLKDGKPVGRLLGSANSTIIEVTSNYAMESKWTHLALTWNSKLRTLTLYRDRLAKTTASTMETVDFGTAPGSCEFAKGFTPAQTGTDALLDEFRFWKSCRSEAEIDRYAMEIIPAPFTSFNRVMPEFESDSAEYIGYTPVAYYRFDDGGRTIEDFAHFQDSAYALTGKVKEEGVTLRGMDDVNGDLVPDWWVQRYNLKDSKIAGYGPLTVRRSYKKGADPLYFQRYFYLDETMNKKFKAVLEFTKGSEVTWYVNGTKIAEKEGTFQDQLRKGRNSLMVKVTRPENTGHLTDFSLEIDGKTVIPARGNDAFDPASIWAWSYDSIDGNYAKGALPEDPDGDDVPVEWEYKLGLHPMNPMTDGVVRDGARDFDEDSLQNAFEVTKGCDPSEKDTDNDGISDAVEISSGYDPLDHNDPLKFRALHFSAADDIVTLPALADFAQKKLTVEMWLKPVSGVQSGCLLKRSLGNSDSGKEIVNYGVRLKDNMVEAFYTDYSGEEESIASQKPLESGAWTHVAVTQQDDGTLEIYFNGALNVSKSCIKKPALTGYGPIKTVLGGIAGANTFTDLLMDDVRIWKTVRTAEELTANCHEYLKGDETGLIAYYRFDDCNVVSSTSNPVCRPVDDKQKLAADSVKEHAKDWRTEWFHAARLARVEMIRELSENGHNDNPIISDKDTDGDGIPDWWEDQYGLNITDKEDAFKDKDGDGLKNFYEYLAGTSPDSSNGSVTDALADSDGDGIDNIDEQALGTHPGLKDSDDDGLDDNVEYADGLGKSDPTNSGSPRFSRALEFAANAGGNTKGGVVTWPGIKGNESLNLKDSSFTIELRLAVKQNNGKPAVFLSKEADIPGRYSYRLEMDAARKLIFTMGAEKLQLTSPVPVSEVAQDSSQEWSSWIHVAAVYDKNTEKMKLRMTADGEAGKPRFVEKTVTAELPGGKYGNALVLGDQTNGVSFRMDELRIWKIARTDKELADYKDAVLPVSDALKEKMVLLATMDDGGATVENMVVRTSYNGKAKLPDLTVAGGMNNVKFVEIPRVISHVDTDNDKIDDWWEYLYFGDITTTDGTVDSDGDGLLDYTEWLTYDTASPLNPKNQLTDGNIMDSEADSDGDGLKNLDEQNMQTHPGKKDTDDDGFADGYEQGVTDRYGETTHASGVIVSNALESLDQPNAAGDGKAGIHEFARIFRMMGGNSMTVANNPVHSGENLTVGFWFRYNTHKSLKLTCQATSAAGAVLLKSRMEGEYFAATAGENAGLWTNRSGFSLRKDVTNRWTLVSDTQRILASGANCIGSYVPTAASAGISSIKVQAAPQGAGANTVSDIVFLKRTVSADNNTDRLNYAFHFLDDRNGSSANLMLEVASSGGTVKVKSDRGQLKAGVLYFVAGVLQKQGSYGKVGLKCFSVSEMSGSQATIDTVRNLQANSSISHGEKGKFVLGSEMAQNWRSGLVLDVDEINIWNRSMTSEELKSICNGQSGIDTAKIKPVSCFIFDDGGNTAEDSMVEADWLNGTPLFGTLYPEVRMAGSILPEFPVGMVKDSSLADWNNDRDHDGLPDDWEIAYFGNLEQTPEGDADGDKVTNRDEYAYGTSPINDDTDNDGMKDYWEIKYGFDPLNSSDAAMDSDMDGLTNAEECVHNTDPSKSDTDGDGLPDGWEVQYRLDPCKGDDDPDKVSGGVHNPDGDSLTNLEEYQNGTDPWKKNNLNDDSDHDGVSDQEEIQNGTDIHLADTDDDEFTDVVEFNRGSKGNDSVSKPGNYGIMDMRRGFDYVGNLVARMDAHSGPLTVPAAESDRRLGFSSWTVEARFRVQNIVYPTDLNGKTVYLVRRSLSDRKNISFSEAVSDVKVSNYYLGYKYLQEKDSSGEKKLYLLPVAGYQIEDENGTSYTRSVSGRRIATELLASSDTRALSYERSKWTFLSASFNISTQELKLYQDGSLVQTVKMMDNCPTESQKYPYAYVKMGENLNDCGLNAGSLELNLDEVRIWGVPDNKIMTAKNRYLKNFVRSDMEIYAGAGRPVMPRLGVYDAGLDAQYGTTGPDGSLLTGNSQTYAIDRRVDDNGVRNALNDGQTGRKAMVCYNDLNDNGRWDSGEDVWLDQKDPDGKTPTKARVYEEKFDIRLAAGRNGWTTPDASVKQDEKKSGDEDKKPAVIGRDLTVYYYDVDKNQKISEVDQIWVDYFNDRQLKDVNQYQNSPQLWAEAMGLALYYRFDDGGMSIEDYAWRNDWKSSPRWIHAIRPDNLLADQKVTDAYEGVKAWVCDTYQKPENRTLAIDTIFRQMESGELVAVFNASSSQMTDILTAVAEAVDPEGGEVTYVYYWLLTGRGQALYDSASLTVENGLLVDNAGSERRIPEQRILGRGKELDLYPVAGRLSSGDTIQLAVYAVNSVGKYSNVKVKNIKVRSVGSSFAKLPPKPASGTGLVYNEGTGNLVLTLEARINGYSEIHVDWFRNLEYFRSSVQRGNQGTPAVSDNAKVTDRTFSFMIDKKDIRKGDVWSYKTYIVYRDSANGISKGTSRVIPPQQGNGGLNRNEWCFRLIGVGYNRDTEAQQNELTKPPRPSSVTIEPRYPDVNSVLIAHPSISGHGNGHQFSYYYEWYISKASGGSSDKDENKKTRAVTAQPDKDGFVRAEGQTGQSWRTGEFEITRPGMVKTGDDKVPETPQNNENGSGDQNKNPDEGLYTDQVLKVNGKLNANDRIYVKVYTMDIYGNRSDYFSSEIVTIRPDPKESNQNTSVSYAFEVNDTFEKARQLLPKKNWWKMDDENVQVHYFHKSQDRDFVWFLVPQNLSGNPSKVTFETNASSENGGEMFTEEHQGALEPGPDTMAQLFDSNYNRILMANDIGFVAPGYRGGTRFARFEKVLEPGIYYVMVTNANASSWAMEAPYAMHLKIQEEGGASGPLSAGNVWITPQTPGTSQSLECKVEERSQQSRPIDGYKYIWFRNYEIVPFNGLSQDIQPWETERYELNSAKRDLPEEPAYIVPAHYTKPNEIWYCKVYSYINDHGVIRYGKPVYSKAVKIQGANWNASFQVTRKYRNPDSSSKAEQLEIGWEEKATHGYDPSFDVAMLPGSAALAKGASYFEGMDNTQTRLTRDVRPYGRAATWFLRIDMGDPSSATISECSITWKSLAMPGNAMNGLKLVQMRRKTNGSYEKMPGGIEAVIEEYRAGEIVLDAAALETLQKDAAGQRFAVFALSIGAPDIKEVIQLSRTGWQLISFPVTPFNNLTEEVLVYNGRPVYNGSVWTYEDGQNVVANRIEAGVGYWLNIVRNDALNQNPRIVVYGSKPSSIPLKKGWNMFGPIEDISDFVTLYGDNRGRDFLDRISRDASGNYEIYSVDAQGEYQIIRTSSGKYPLKKGIGYWIYLKDQMDLPVRIEKTTN